MDNNNPVMPSVLQTNTTPVAPPIQPIPPVEKDGNKMIIFLVLGVVLVILIVGGIYYFLSIQQQTPAPVAPITESPAPKAPVVAKDALDAELEEINVASSGAEFQSVDSDLQSL